MKGRATAMQMAIMNELGEHVKRAGIRLNKDDYMLLGIRIKRSPVVIGACLRRKVLEIGQSAGKQELSKMEELVGKLG